MNICRTVFPAFLVFFILACDGVVDPPPVREGPVDRWEVALRSSTLAELNGVWGTSPADVIAVGDSGVILHYNGVTVERMESGTKEHLTGVWGSSSTEYYAVGQGGTILRYDGVSWTPMSSPTRASFRSIWGRADSVFATAGGHIFLLPPGGDWSLWATLDGSVAITDIHGAPGHGLVAVGHYRYNTWVAWTHDGSGWIPSVLPGDQFAGQREYLTGVWMDDHGQVLAVGNQSIAGGGLALLESRGGAWKADPVVTGIEGPTFARIHGSDGLAMAVGSSPGRYMGYPFAMVIRDGYRDVLSDVPTLYPLLDVWASSSTAVFVVGDQGTFVRWDGSTWTTLAQGVPPLHAVEAARDDEVVVGGDRHAFHLEGAAWTAADDVYNQFFRDLWGEPGSGLVGVGYGGSGNGLVFEFRGGEWHHRPPELLYGGAGYLAVDGPHAEALLAIGHGGLAFLLKDGEAQAIPTPTDVDLRGVWWSPTESAYHVVGDNGTILRYDDGWNTPPSPTDADLTDVWGSSDAGLFAVGTSPDGGVILRQDSGQWVIAATVPEGLHAVHGLGPAEIYVAGDAGAVYRFDGSDWTRSETAFTGRITALSGSNRSDLWAVSEQGAVLRGIR